MKRVRTVPLTALFAVVTSIPTFAQVLVTDSSSYLTVDQMLLANEINESGEPYAEAIGYDLDILDPFAPGQPDETAYVLGIENYEYSRYQLGVVIARSGMGLHMMWAPVIGEMAAMEPPETDGMYTGGMANGFMEDDVLMKMVMHFGMLANQMPPANPWPQFGEFISGTPRYAQEPDPDFGQDFSTLRWDRSSMTMQLSPGAMGQTLMKQYLWAQDMLGGYHDADGEGIEPDGVVSPDLPGEPMFDPDNGVYYGGDDLDGFVGQVLTAEAINKVKNILTNLAYDGSDLGGVDPITYDPAAGIRYFPHLIGVEEAPIDGVMLPPRPETYTVVDPASWLFDQVSLLWGAESFANMMDPANDSSSAHTAYHTVFDGDPFPADMAATGMPGPFDLMKGASKVIFMNLMAMHFDADAGTFTNTANLVDGSALRGDRISSFNAGYTVMVLAGFVPEFAGTPLEDAATSALTAQADFILAHLSDPMGGFYNGAFVDGSPFMDSKGAMAQAGALRGLYAAYMATGDETYLGAANSGYDYLISHFWVPEHKGFRTTKGASVARYTPKVVAALSGALREARLVGEKTEATSIYVDFWNSATRAMQLAEGDATGEIGGDSDGDGIPFIPEQPNRLAPVFASEATQDLGGDGSGEGSSGGVGPVACAGPYTTWVELAANTAGAAGSHWHTDLVAHNTMGMEANIQLNLHSEDGVSSWSTEAGPMTQLVLEDVVATMGITGVGSLEICSDQPLEVISRTYSDSGQGTVGQFLDGREGGGLVAGQSARLLGLRQLTGTYRSNISVTNASPMSAQVSIVLYRTTGMEVGRYTLTVPSGQTVQDLQPFSSRFGQSDLGWGFATVTVTSGEGVLASASVIDSRTNDATTIAMKRR